MKNDIIKVWYCNYDGYYVIKRTGNRYEITPSCLQPELMGKAIKVNAFSQDWVMYV